jgi:FAD/FMN-containing dehydrogenase
MSLSATLTSDLGDLSLSFGRKLVLPDDERFDEARRAWNLAVDQRPAAVVFPESAQDVVAAVMLARESGGQVAAQGTGHNAGPLGSLENTILLKTERMRDVVIDPARRVARVGAGVLAAELVLAAGRHGLAAVAGTSPDVGVVGFTLGGGIGVLSRRFGLAANHVRAFEVVTADGQLVRTDREQEPDLFWALRGGGGSFGVVTAMELELLPVTRVYAGTLWYPIERAREVLEATLPTSWARSGGSCTFRRCRTSRRRSAASPLCSCTSTTPQTRRRPTVCWRRCGHSVRSTTPSGP